MASGMAIHKKWRQLIFPHHPKVYDSAYPFSGPVRCSTVGATKLTRWTSTCPTAIWPPACCAQTGNTARVTVEDVVRGGCNLFNLYSAPMEYSRTRPNLLMCEFAGPSRVRVSRSASGRRAWWTAGESGPTFMHWPCARLAGAKCGSVMTRQKQYRRTATAPDAWWWHRQPCQAGSSRILERHQWRGMDFRAQADAIKKLTEQYNVTDIGIDSTGVGHVGSTRNAKAFFPAVREFVYNPNVKNALVLKAYDIISHRRLEFDAGHTDIAQSFMAIRRATTASGNRPTYEASRSEEASHADLAWATMHALFNEPPQGESANTSNIVEIF